MATASIPQVLLFQSADALQTVVDGVRQRELDFLTPNDWLAEQSRKATRLSFNLAAAVGPVKGPLAQLHTKGFEHEGVWEQLKMHGKATIDQLESAIEAAIAAGVSSEDEDTSDAESSSDAEDEEEDDEEEEADDEEAARIARIRKRAMAFEDGDDDEEEEEGARAGDGGLDPEVFTWTGQVRESALPLDPDAAKTSDKVFDWNNMDRFLEDMEEAQERGMAEAMGEGAEDARRPKPEGEAEAEAEEEESEEEEPDVDYFSAKPTAAIEAHERVAGGGSLVQASGEGDDDALASIAGYLAKQKQKERQQASSSSSGVPEDLGRRAGETKEQALKRIRAMAAEDDDFFGPRRQRGRAADSRPRFDEEEEYDEEDYEHADDDEEAEDDEEADEDEEEEDGPSSKRVRFAGGGEQADGDVDGAGDEEEEVDEVEEEVDEVEEEAADPKTSYAKGQAALKAQIAMLEGEALNGYLHKHWLMKGEVDAGARPENSLLEAALEHETAIRPPPPLTAQATVALEDLIRRRIADGLFDDPEKRERARPDMGDTEKGEELSTEKAARGLGDEYEASFREKAMGQKRESQAEALEKEVAAAWATLSGRLDALSNMTFTPRMSEMDAAEADEEAGRGGDGVRVRSTAPALSMEDVQPTMGPAAAALAADGVAGAAPQELKAAARGRAGVVVGDSELAPDEKQRRRKAAKAVRRKRRRASDSADRAAARLNPGLGNKHEVDRLARELGSQKHVTEGKDSGRAFGDFATSSRFFSRMQDEAKLEAAKLSGAAAGHDDDNLAAVSKRSRKGKRSRGGAAASVKL